MCHTMPFPYHSRLRRLSALLPRFSLVSLVPALRTTPPMSSESICGPIPPRPWAPAPAGLSAAGDFELNSDWIQIGRAVSPGEQDKLRSPLKKFMPWRKGPYNFFGIEIDCEWRSDMKWERLRNDISALKPLSLLSSSSIC